MEGKILKKHLFYAFIAIVTCFAIQVTAFAAETTVADISVSSNDTVDEANSEGTFYGSLSGYASHTHHASDSRYGSFTIQVSGSWSPWAGLTVKTSFPDGNCTFGTLHLTRPDGTQIGDTLRPSANGEIKNVALYNVPAGTYTVHYSVESTCDGTIEVYIY